MSVALQQPVPDPLAAVRAVAPLLEAGGAYSDRAGCLDPAVVQALQQADLFRLLMPRRIGGAQVAPAVYVQVIEELAKHDGSAAWCVNQASGIGMGCSHLPHAAAQQVWGNPQGIAAWGPPASKAISMRAAPGGYRVDYDGNFASGSTHATWLGGFIQVKEADGSPRLMADGKGELRAFVVPKAAATMTVDWDVLGLRGTGSNSYSLRDVFVPAEHTWVRDGDSPDADPYYRFRAGQVWAGGFASISLGLAQGMLDAFIDLATNKIPRDEASPLRESGVVQHEVALCHAKLGAARLYYRAALEAFVAELRTRQTPTLDMRIAYRLAATHAIHSAREVGETIYDAAGATAIFNNGAFARRYRDLRTVTQQLNGRKAHYANVGRHLLGLKPAMIGL